MHKRSVILHPVLFKVLLVMQNVMHICEVGCRVFGKSVLPVYTAGMEAIKELNATKVLHLM